jgi:microcystin-dependent protein
MTRVKTFDNTGIATSGRLYAGDLNLIQDQFADLINLLQTHAVGTLQIGESGLQLLRYGAGEARLSGMLRTDGILRALGGVYAGAFTTAQRDAIPAGSRPYGLIVLNTTTNRPEWNSGSDAAPAWIPFSDANAGVLVGSTIEWPWVHTQLPANYLLAYGQAVSRATYPVLNAIASASGYPHGNGDGSTTFNLPDHRGRVSVGRDDMGTVAANRITAASGITGTQLGASGGVQTIALVAGEMPVHNHGLVAATVTGVPTITGGVTNGSLALGGAISHTLSLSGSPALSGSISHNHTLTGSPALAGSVAHTLSVYRTADVGWTEPGHSHAAHNWSQHAGGGNTDFGVGGSGDESYNTYYVDGAGSGGYIYQQPSFALSGGVNNGSLSVNSGSLALAGGVNNGTLSVNSGSLAIAGGVNNGSLSITGTISNGTLACAVGSLDVGGTTDNAGSGSAHNNVQPSIIVNRAIRVS